jgi:hypothetical protein
MSLNLRLMFLAPFQLLLIFLDLKFINLNYLIAFFEYKSTPVLDEVAQLVAQASKHFVEKSIQSLVSGIQSLVLLRSQLKV